MADVGYLQGVNMQSTFISGLRRMAWHARLTALALIGCAGEAVLTAATDPVLSTLLVPRQAMTATGTVSVQGPMNISGVPFDAALHSDTIVVNTGSPFGMKTSSVYARADSFVVLNFLTRQAIDGDPHSEKLAGLLPIPLGIDDIRHLVRGVPPGDLSAFVLQTRRQDGSYLFRRRDTAIVEFALIDTATRTLRQYQRKEAGGKTLLNVTYGSYRVTDGVMVPYGVDVTANDEAQKVQFRFDDVRLLAPTEPMRPLRIPASFTRVTLN